MLEVENVHIFYQSDEILHIFVEPFILFSKRKQLCMQLMDKSFSPFKAMLTFYFDTWHQKWVIMNSQVQS